MNHYLRELSLIHGLMLSCYGEFPGMAARKRGHSPLTKKQRKARGKKKVQKVSRKTNRGQ